MKHQSLAEAEHASISEVAGVPAWASIPGIGRFAGVGLKTGGTSDAFGWRRWSAHGIIAKVASR